VPAASAYVPPEQFHHDATTDIRFVDAASKSVAYNDTIKSMKCIIGTIAWGVVRHSVVGG
jgi:hypothetical protein